MRTSKSVALAISTLLLAILPVVAGAQTDTDADAHATAPPVDVVPPVIPLQPNLPGSIQPGMPGIPNTTAGTQALGQGGLPAGNIPGANSPYAAPRTSPPTFTCPPASGGTTVPGSGGGAVYGSQYGENLGGGPGSTNAQASAVLGTGCPPSQ